MEHSSIGLIVWILAVVLMAIVFIYCMCRDFCGRQTSINNLRYSSPTPPPPATWNTKTETRPKENIGPWFLVVYADEDERNYTVVAAEDVLDFYFSGKRGEMRIHCKKHNGFPDNTMRFENIHHYEFQQASRLGDYRDMEEE